MPVACVIYILTNEILIIVFLFAMTNLVAGVGLNNLMCNGPRRYSEVALSEGNS